MESKTPLRLLGGPWRLNTSTYVCSYGEKFRQKDAFLPENEAIFLWL
jgi:hypothetical protein